METAGVAASLGIDPLAVLRCRDRDELIAVVAAIRRAVEIDVVRQQNLAVRVAAALGGEVI